MSLTPEEQLFFQTGDAASLTGTTPQPQADPAAPNAIDLQALSTVAPAPAPAPVAAPVAPPVVAAPVAPPAEAPEIAVLRQTIRDTQRELAELQAQKAQAQAPAPAPAPAPDPEVDPLGALMHELKSMREEVAAIKAASTQLTEQQQQQQRFQTFQQQVLSLRDQFVKDTPDFADAYTHLRNIRVADLTTLGYTDQQAHEAILREEVALSEKAIREARNPASVIYDMAKRHGYAPKAAQAPASAPAPAPIAGPTAEAIQRAQAAARQLPAQPTSGEVELTEQGLRQASEADLNRMVLDDSAWGKLTKSDQYPL